MKTKLQLLVITLLFSATVFSQTGVGCWREVSAGENFSLGIKTDGTLWGWGQNGNRLGLGIGNLANQNLPVQIGIDTDWLAVSAGNVHSLAVKTNGTLWTWGNGQFGQLGNGVFNSATANVTQIGTATDWIAVSAGNRFSLAIKTTGTLWSWGLNATGQLGIGNIIDQNLPVQVGSASNWSQIDAGNQHSLAIDTLGFMWAWGNNTFGQLGDGTNTTSLVPILIGSANNWTSVSAGFDHSLALNSFQFIFSTGNNTNGQLCNGTNTASNVFGPAAAAGAQPRYIAISAGNAFSLAIRDTFTLWSGGFNNFGQLGLGNNTAVNTFNQVGTNNNYFDISAGDVHSLVLDNSLSLSSTGRGLEGQLGIGTNANMNTLQAVSCPTSALGNNEMEIEDMKIIVYPNPTNGIVNVNYNIENASTIRLRLTSIQGQLIKEVKMIGVVGLQTTSIDMSNQTSGMYFITLTTENESLTTKVVKR